MPRDDTTEAAEDREDAEDGGDDAPLLTIGELARRAGVATSALRYYEDLGLLRPAQRRSGRRYYDAAALDVVGGILLLQDVGFTLAEIGRLWTDDLDRAGQDALLARKLDELARQAERIAVARAALDHALDCPAPRLTECRSFRSIARERLGNRFPWTTEAAASPETAGTAAPRR
ncbi:MAG TPA: MerR family transcriptional regulator [Acidimicrobiales bacterium]